jgi:hypothetical protein
MATKVYAKGAVEDASKVLAVWKERAEFKLSDVTFDEMQALFTEVTGLEEQIEDLQRKLTTAVNNRNDKAKVLAGYSSRVRMGIRGFYGPDSNEYELAGGTRSSERKRPVRKPRTDD